MTKPPAISPTRAVRAGRKRARTGSFNRRRPLAAGGSKHHKELLAPFGLDASDPRFWDKGLSMIEGFIDELEALEA